MKRIFPLLLFVFLLGGCRLIGINLEHKTPSRAGKYPKFDKADSLLGSLNKYRSCYDVHFYDLSVKFFPDKKSIVGVVQIHFKAEVNFSKLQIDLVDRFDIISITHGGVPLNFKREYRAVFVQFPEEIEKGTEDMIEISYSGKPRKAKKPPWEGGFVYKKDDNKNPWMGVACELDGASIWWPVKDHLTDEPDSMKMHYSVPQGLYCVANGSLESREVNGDYETFNWKVSYPINSYNATFYIGDFEYFTLPYNHGNREEDLHFYVLKENLEKAKKHFLQVEEIMKFFEDTFGDYPYWRDGYKLVESPFAGMEHQSGIAYGSNYNNQTGYDHDYIILHESAHEWWGNSISATDYCDIWLHEGFATYSEALFVEHKYGYEQYLNYLDWYGVLVKNKRPIIGPCNVNFWEVNDSDPYMKGALTLHTFRNTLNNDSLFFEIIKGFYSKYKYGFARTDDFMAYVNEMTNDNYDWLFEQYLYKRTCPALKVQQTYVDDEIVLMYKWDNDLDLPLPIELVNMKEGSDRIIIYPGKDVKTIAFDISKAYEINPKGSYIALIWTDKLVLPIDPNMGIVD